MRAGGEVGAVRVKGGSRQLRAPDSEERGPVAIACRSGDFGTMRDFNTAGPVRPEKNYCTPPLDRLNLRQVLALIRSERYFVLHAPRQTGKTSALLALRDLLNGGQLSMRLCERRARADGP